MVNLVVIMEVVEISGFMVSFLYKKKEMVNDIIN